MTILLILLGVALFWIACGWLSYKGGVAYCQVEFPLAFQTEKDYAKDRTFHKRLAFGGPCTLLAMVFSDGFQHGLSVPAPEVDADYEAAQDAWIDEERAFR